MYIYIYIYVRIYTKYRRSKASQTLKTPFLPFYYSGCEWQAYTERIEQYFKLNDITEAEKRTATQRENIWWDSRVVK